MSSQPKAKRSYVKKSKIVEEVRDTSSFVKADVVVEDVKDVVDKPKKKTARKSKSKEEKIAVDTTNADLQIEKVVIKDVPNKNNSIESSIKSSDELITKEHVWKMLGELLPKQNLIVAHQIESYNDFIKNQFEKTFKIFNPICIRSEIGFS